jgi:hypothetical protein
MAKPFRSETRYHGNWAVTIYADPADEGFYTRCVSPSGLELCTEICHDKGAAWQCGYSLVEQVEKEEQIQRYRAIAVPLTLALLYIAGWDEYYEFDDKSHLRGRRTWKNHDWDILNLLTDQRLLEEQRNPQQIKSVVLTPEGIKQARQILSRLNLEGIEEFLKAHSDHDDLPDALREGDTQDDDVEQEQP